MLKNIKISKPEWDSNQDFVVDTASIRQSSEIKITVTCLSVIKPFIAPCSSRLRIRSFYTALEIHASMLCIPWAPVFKSHFLGVKNVSHQWPGKTSTSVYHFFLHQPMMIMAYFFHQFELQFYTQSNCRGTWNLRKMKPLLLLNFTSYQKKHWNSFIFYSSACIISFCYLLHYYLLHSIVQ